MRTKLNKLALLLSLSLLLPVFASCGDTPPADDDVITDAPVSSGTEDTTEPPEVETSVIDTVEQRNLDGYTFKWVAQNTGTRINFPAAEESTGEAKNDAMLDRNNATENRLNMNLELIAYDNRDTLSANVAAAIRADEHIADAVTTAFSAGINTLTVDGLLLDMTTVPHLTLDSSLWNEWIAQNMRIDGKQFFTTGGMSLMSYLVVSGVGFNKDLIKDNELEDPYELVADHKWTVDKMNEMMQKAAKDFNGDGSRVSTDDIFGLVADGTFGNALLNSMGIMQIETNDEGKWVTTFLDNQTIDIVEKCSNIFTNTDTALLFPNGGTNMTTTFQEGRSLFMACTTVSMAIQQRDMENDFGLLPIPTVEETNGEYLNACNTWSPAGIGIPKTAKELDKIGLVMETLAAYSQEIVRPVIIEKTIGVTARDQIDYITMVDLLEHAVYDLNTILDFNGSSAAFRGSVLGYNNNGSYTSAFTSIAPTVQEALDAFIEACQKSE